MTLTLAVSRLNEEDFTKDSYETACVNIRCKVVNNGRLLRPWQILNHPPSMGISGIWNNMVNFIHDFGYLGLGYMEFPLIWDILAGTNASLITGNVCIGISTRVVKSHLHIYSRTNFPFGSILEYPMEMCRVLHIKRSGSLHPTVH